MKADLEEYHKQKIMPNEDKVMTEIRDLLFGTRPKSKDVIDKCQEYARGYHQSQLQALKEEVNGITNTVEFAIKENPHNREEMLLKAMNKLHNLITNLEE